MKKLVSFFEIPSTDFSRAVKFYETILGISIQAMDWECEKMGFFLEEDGTCAGSISWTANILCKPSKDGVLISLQCENMEQTIGLIEKNGGNIIMPKTKIEAEGRGYFALFIDSEGNRMGLYSDK